LIIRADQNSPVPLFEQLRGQIAGAVESGQIPAGQRLPTVRQLAADLRIAVNTVARAYQELEAAGMVEARGRHGTFAVGRPSQARQAEEAAAEFTARMRRMGVGPQEILAMVRRQLGMTAADLSPAVTARPGVVPS